MNFDEYQKLAMRTADLRHSTWSPAANPRRNTWSPAANPRCNRDALYETDKEHGHISADVRRWCIENQDNPRYRIVLAGYEGEHDLPGWRKIEWVAGRAYGSANGVDSGNRRKERLWLSPYTQGGEFVQVQR